MITDEYKKFMNEDNENAPPENSQISELVKTIKMYLYENDYKDFITIEQFIKIFYNIIKNNLRGIYNVSLGKKIYIDEILKWLNYKNLNKNKLLIKKNTHYYDSFTLNNKKLINSIKIKINKSEIKNFCRIMAKKIYYQFNNSI
jgi:hypothetical protein